MTHRLATNYAKNYCNWTPIVKVIVENVVTCFFWDTVYFCPMCDTINAYKLCSLYNALFFPSHYYNTSLHSPLLTVSLVPLISSHISLSQFSPHPTSPIFGLQLLIPVRFDLEIRRAVSESKSSLVRLGCGP